MSSNNGFDVAGMIRRARREADLSQRDLADALGVSASVVGRWETGEASPPVTTFAAIMQLAGLRVTVMDADDQPVVPMCAEGLRDRAGRRRPAHLDVVALESDYVPRYDRPRQQVWVPRRRRRGKLRRRCAAGEAIRGLGTEWVAGPDHPRATDIGEQLERWHRERARRQVRFVRGPDPCHCRAECYEGRGCASGCECACEPNRSASG